jgi:hypothetical protein
MICNSIIWFHSDACNERALCNEIMILEVLEAKEPAVFRQELFTTLVHRDSGYYEEIQGQHGAPAAGRPKPKSFKRKMKSLMLFSAPAETADSESTEKAPEEPQAAGGHYGGAELQVAAAGAAPAGRPRVKGGAKA